MPFIFFIGLVSCETPSPNFNPFVEDDPNLSVEKILNDTALKRKGDCMAWSYAKNFGAYDVFYVIYSLPDGTIIEGKGLEIPLSKGIFTLRDISLEDDFFTKTVKRYSKIDSILRNAEIDTLKVDSILNGYGLTKTKKIIVESTSPDIELKKYYWFYKDSLGNEYLFEKKLDIKWLSDIRAIGIIKIYFDSRLKYEINKDGLLDVHMQ